MGKRLRSVIGRAVLTAVCVGMLAPIAAADLGPRAPIAFTAQWSQAIKAVNEGKVDEARTVLNNIAEHSGDPAKARTWVEDWLTEQLKRRELTQADYTEYVGRAHKDIAKQDWPHALKWTYWSLLNTAEKEAFRQLDWVVKLRSDVMAAAIKLHDNNEWRDAHELYYALGLIFEKDKQIDKLRRECLEHARLDAIYKDEKDWAESLEGITHDMFHESLYRIDQKYVVEGDFRKLTISGYEELLLVADSPAVQKLCPTLKDDRGKEFVRRLTKRLEQIKSETKLSMRDARDEFNRALEINRQTAQVPEAILVREYAGAALEQLDEFTTIIWPYEFREFDKHTRGDFIGVGIQIRNKYSAELKDTEILVVSPLEDAPAYRAGVLAEDVITKVNGKSLVGIPVTKAVSMITGPLDTTVTLTLKRTKDNGEIVEWDVPLKRDVVRIQSVKSLARKTGDEERWDFVQDKDFGITYVRVGSFQDNTVAQLRTALSDAQAQGMHGLILDFRYNPGGLLKAAVEMAELFLPKGARVVSTKGLRSKEFPQDADSDGAFKDVPMIVLVNESSASASEVVSGALKDHGRALILGERTYGKFSVQNLIQLDNSDAHLKLTTARYYLPSGRSLHREEDAKEWGVGADVEVALVPKEQTKIILMRRDADVLGAVKTKSEKELDEPVAPTDADANSNGVADAEEELPDPNNRPDRDPQLETAMLLMRLHLLNDSGLRVAEHKPMVPVGEKVENK
jgi:carboxyl-terminal processing protease